MDELESFANLQMRKVPRQRTYPAPKEAAGRQSKKSCSRQKYAWRTGKGSKTGGGLHILNFLVRSACEGTPGHVALETQWWLSSSSFKCHTPALKGRLGGVQFQAAGVDAESAGQTLQTSNARKTTWRASCRRVSAMPAGWKFRASGCARLLVRPHTWRPGAAVSSSGRVVVMLLHSLAMQVQFSTEFPQFM